MEPIPLKECHKQLQSLEYSPILGNKHTSKTSQLPKLNFTRLRVNSFSATASAVTAARRLSSGHVTPRKRLFSESGLSSSESTSEHCSKMSKSDDKDIAKMLEAMQNQMINSEKRLSEQMGNNHTQLSGQLSELRERQDVEAQARQALESKVNNMQEQFHEMSVKIDQNALADADAVAEAMGPQIDAAVARHMKSKENQINATYYQSLVIDLKNHEKDIMIYGFQTDGSPDLENNIRQKLFKDKLDLDIGAFKAVQVGSEIRGKPKPIRVSFNHTEIRNSVCKKASKLPKDIRIDKCLPQRYRQPHREFREYSWQLKEAADVQTRVVFKAHKLVLEMRQPDDGELRYDWTIAKEYFPQPQSPTDRSETQRDRQGLKASKTIEQIGTNKVILSNLTVTADMATTKAYFKDTFVTADDKEKIVEVDAEKVVSKKLIIVTLRSKKECADFKDKYEKIDFNEQKPRISVMLGTA